MGSYLNNLLIYPIYQSIFASILYRSIFFSSNILSLLYSIQLFYYHYISFNFFIYPNRIYKLIKDYKKNNKNIEK